MSSVATSDGKDWQREATAELVSALARLDSLAKQVEGTPSQTQVKSIWNCYLAVEKNVAFIRLELDEENPGRFVNAKAYVVPDERQALAFASNSLRRGIALLQAGDPQSGAQGSQGISQLSSDAPEAREAREKEAGFRRDRIGFSLVF